MSDHHFSYLTPEEKARHVEKWHENVQQSRAENFYGPAAVDPEIIPWVDKLDAIDGLCVVWSCTGHKQNNKHDKKPGAGFLWFRMSKEVMEKFEQRCWQLAENISLHVSRDYEYDLNVRGVRHTIKIYFTGCDLDKEALERSVGQIYTFFSLL